LSDQGDPHQLSAAASGPKEAAIEKQGADSHTHHRISFHDYYNRFKNQVVPNTFSKNPHFNIILVAAFSFVDLLVRWIANFLDSVISDRGYLTVGSIVGGYLVVYGLIDTKHQQEVSAAASERSQFITLVSANNVDLFVAAMKSYGKVQAMHISAEPDLFAPWYWGRRSQPNLLPLWRVMNPRLASCKKGTCSISEARIDLMGADLSNTDLHAADLSSADMNNALLSRANLSGASMTGAHLSFAQLDNANLSEALAEYSDFSAANLEMANLSGISLNNANLTQAKLDDAILDKASLGFVQLNGAYLERAHIDNAYLYGAKLEGTDLINAHLATAYLVEADLRGANFHGANLTGANLTGAKFNPVDEDFYGKDSPSGANLTGSVLTQADLSNSNVTQSQLDTACGSDVILPPGLTLKPCR
jgi:uncharacterized protein YjbI with pentapeptide repeats